MLKPTEERNTGGVGHVQALSVFSKVLRTKHQLSQRLEGRL